MKCLSLQAYDSYSSWLYFFQNFIEQIHQWKHWENDIQKDVAQNGIGVLVVAHILM